MTQKRLQFSRYSLLATRYFLEEFMKYQDFLKDLKQGKIGPLYFFTGAEEYLKKEALHSLYQLLVNAEQKDFNYALLYGKDSSVEEVLDQAEALPFMAGRRLVIVKEFEKLTKKDKLLAYLQNPNKTTCLVLVLSSGEKKSTATIFRELAPYEVIFYPLFESELKKWIGARFANGKKKVDAGVVDVIIESSGTDLGLIASEIEKMIISFPDKSHFTEQDINALLFRHPEKSAASLEKHILSRNVDKALLALKDLLSEGTNETYLLGVVTNTVRKLIGAKEMLERNCPEEEISSKYYMRSFSDRKLFFSYLPQSTLADLVLKHKRIAEADRLIKTGRRDAGMVLEQLVFYLCR